MEERLSHGLVFANAKIDHNRKIVRFSESASNLSADRQDDAHGKKREDR